MLVIVYVPVTRRYDPWVRSAIEDSVEVFGGMTEVQGVGHWIDDEGKDVAEAVSVLTYATPYDRLADDEVIILKQVVSKVLTAGEQAVAVVVNHRLHLYRDVDHF